MSTPAEKRYYETHKALIAERGRKWQQEHRERYNELQRQWKVNNPEKVKAKNADWRNQNPEKVQAMKHRWYLKYQEREIKNASIRAKIRRQRPEVKERERQLHKEWSKNNPDKVAAKARRWRLSHPEQVRAYAIHETYKRRARQRGNTVNPKSILVFTKAVKTKRFAVCYYCQKRVSTRKIHFDHIQPLSKGGAHSVENLCVSCADCNQHKHTSSVQDWIEVGQQIFAL